MVTDPPGAVSTLCKIHALGNRRLYIVINLDPMMFPKSIRSGMGAFQRFWRKIITSIVNKMCLVSRSFADKILAHSPKICFKKLATGKVCCRQGVSINVP